MPLGFWEILLIVVAVILIFGAQKLPEFGRSLAKGIREFKSASNENSSDKKDKNDADAKQKLEHGNTNNSSEERKG